jgi:hypothetical protein
MKSASNNLGLGLSDKQLEALRMENLGVWCALNEFKVDHKPFTFKDRKFLKDIYLCNNPNITVRKCTQVGLTIWMILKVLHQLRYSQSTGRKIARKAGFYFPVFDSVAKFSKDRLRPLIYGIPEFNETLSGPPSIDLVQFGSSSLYLSYTGGVASMDSTPMDILCLDEVRLMQAATINQLEERLSGCLDPSLYKISTAGYPNDAIDKSFMLGDQRYWHTNCKCSDGVILPDVFPECVGQRRNSKSGKPEFFYRCPKCGQEDLDPQDGGYVVHNPQSDYASFHIHQLLSPAKSAKNIWERYITTDNPKEFWNATLGKPYVDEDNIGLTEAEIQGCVNTDLSWNAQVNNTCMGVDQRSGNMHVVVAKYVGDKKRIVHIEVVDNQLDKYKEAGKVVSPFKRVYEMMKEFDVDLCVLDALPNANEAKDFARAFPGRVFLSYYKESTDMVRWSDKKASASEKPHSRKSSEDLKFKWVVFLDRYKSIDYALRQWVGRRVECPNPRGLIQELRNMKTGAYEPSFVCEDEFFKHLKAVVRELVQNRNDPTNYRYRWNYLGLDPHLLHAWNYCCVALERKKRSFSFEFI